MKLNEVRLIDPAGREFITRALRMAAIALFVAAIPVFLITSNVRWVIGAPFLYSYGFDRYDIPAYTGIEREHLLSVAAQIRDYFNNGEEYLVVRTVVRGIYVESLYNRREIIHMRDVKGLVQGVYRVQEVTGLYLLAFGSFGLALRGRRFLPSLSRNAGIGGGFTLGLVTLVGLVSLVGFDRLFLAFHLVSFANDFWQLDPRRDYLIAMFPQGFFFDATMLIAGSTIAEAILLAAAPLALSRWRRWRGFTGAAKDEGQETVKSGGRSH